MSEWWAALTLVQQILYVIAGLSTTFLVLQLLLNLIGLAGGDADVDIGSDADMDLSTDHGDLSVHSSGLALISFRTVTAFFVGFGWSGIVLLDAGLNTVLAIAIAVCVGCFFVVVVFYLMKELLGLSETGNINISNAIGQAGTVYVTIPAKGAGKGQVQLKVQGRLREKAAITNDDEDLKTGRTVKVVKILGGNTLLVERMELK